MAYINQPIDLRLAFEAIKDRLRKLETAVRFTAPDVSTEPTYPRVGDIIYNNTNNYMEYWNGTEWVIFGDNNVGSPKIPFTSTWTGTGLAHTGTPASGYYIKIGKSIFFTINVSCATVTNFGTGQYSLTIPFAPDDDYIITSGGIHDISTGFHYQIAADLEGGSTTVTLWYQSSNGRNLAMEHNQPVALAVADYFYISGTYFIP